MALHDVGQIYDRLDAHHFAASPAKIILLCRNAVIKSIQSATPLGQNTAHARVFRVITITINVSLLCKIHM